MTLCLASDAGSSGSWFIVRNVLKLSPDIDNAFASKFSLNSVTDFLNTRNRAVTSAVCLI